jgi:hypothetical protein
MDGHLDPEPHAYPAGSDSDDNGLDDENCQEDVMAAVRHEIEAIQLDDRYVPLFINVRPLNDL